MVLAGDLRSKGGWVEPAGGLDGPRPLRVCGTTACASQHEVQ